MRTPALVTVCLVFAACGSTRATGGDAGGGGDASDATDGAPSVPLTTRRSFEVTARQRPTSGVRVPTSMTNTFTLVLDPTAGLAIAGGGGEAAAVALSTNDGITFRITTPFAVGISQDLCVVRRLAYDSLDVTVEGDHLSGSAKGRTFIPQGGPTPVMEVPFEVVLDGVPDTTPPFLILPPGASTSDPMAPFQLWTSEPLPSGALARLVGGDGAVAGLVPEIIGGVPPLIASFGRPTVTLPPGLGFGALFSDDVVDFAGNVAPLGEALRLGSVSAAPLLAPDGFESAVDKTAGGAAILRAGPGIPIAGNASVYISQQSSPFAEGTQATPKLIARMSVPPGASKLVFGYRLLAYNQPFVQLEHVGFVQLGSVGRAPGPETPISPISTFQTVMWGVQTELLETPVATMEVALPDDIGPEVVVIIRSPPQDCFSKSGMPGLVIDDLRIE